MFEIKSKELSGLSFDDVLAKLEKEHASKWVAILENGTLLVKNTLEECLDASSNERKVFIHYTSNNPSLLV